MQTQVLRIRINTSRIRTRNACKGIKISPKINLLLESEASDPDPDGEKNEMKNMDMNMVLMVTQNMLGKYEVKLVFPKITSDLTTLSM